MSSSISKGQEIFNDYGALPRSDLLRRYGYITDNYTKYDVAEISIDLILSTIQSPAQLKHSIGQTLEPLGKVELEKRIKLAEREGVYENSYDIAHASSDGWSIPYELIALLYLLLLDNQNLMAIEASHSALPSRSKLATELVGQVFTVVLQLREKEYETTIEDDERLLSKRNLLPRKKMAVKVRLGEKQILREAFQEANRFSATNKRMRVRHAIKQASPEPKDQESSSNLKKRRRLK